MSIPLFKPWHGAGTDAAALGVLRSGQIASGPMVAEFERALVPWVGQPHVVSTSDMSSALMIALHVLGVRAADEVLSPAYTCLSSTAPLVHLGARPRWVDVDGDTGLMDPQALAARISPSTKACVVYHAAGYPARMAEIAAICGERGIPLIEDCNTALDARLAGQRVGAWGDAAIHSFYPNRQINAGEGGAIAWRKEDHAEAARRLRRFGIPANGFRDAMGELSATSDVPDIGWSASLSQLNAALGLAQLPQLQERLAATQANAQNLAQRLQGLPGLRVVTPTPTAEPAFWGLLVLVQRRDAVLGALKAAGVLASKLHHRVDRYSGFHAEAIELPGTASFLSRVIALPCGHWLSDSDLDRIAHCLRQALQAAKPAG